MLFSFSVIVIVAGLGFLAYSTMNIAANPDNETIKRVMRPLIAGFVILLAGMVMMKTDARLGMQRTLSRLHPGLVVSLDRPGLVDTHVASKLTSWSSVLSYDEFNRPTLAIAVVDMPTACKLDRDLRLSLGSMVGRGYTLTVIGQATLPQHRWLLKDELGTALGADPACAGTRFLVDDKTVQILSVAAHDMQPILAHQQAQGMMSAQMRAAEQASSLWEARSVPNSGMH